jgi:hypothetical protein
LKLARIQKLKLTLFCNFTGEEMDAKGEALSTAYIEYDRVEEQKKTASAEYGDQLKALRGEMRQLAGQIRKKGAERAVDCVTQFHTPEVGMKTTIRTDTGEIVKTEPMTNDERQENLFEEVDALEQMYNAPDAREQESPPFEGTDEQPGK